MLETISAKDRDILRSLACKQAEYAEQSWNKQLESEWRRHRRFEKGRPMVSLEIGGFREEVYGPRLRCESPKAREMERQLLSAFLNHELFEDDKVVPGYFGVKWDTWFTLFHIPVVKEFAENSMGHHFVPQIQDLEDDWEKLLPSCYGVNRESTMQKKELAEQIFGDILPVKLDMPCLCAVPTQDIIHLMGMENFMFALYDYPELVKEMMERVADDYIAYFRWMEQEQLLLPTTGCQWLGQGSFCYTDELPSNPTPVRTQDVWGFMDSQETVGISHAMYEEFIFPCYKKIAGVMGLLSYGCCEPVDGIWETCLSTLPNLRNVSVSAWCDEKKMGEYLAGKKVVFHRKPSANFLSASETLDEPALRKHFRATLEAARGCQLEIVQRDILTMHHNMEKGRRYIEILRDEIEKHWII